MSQDWYQDVKDFHKQVMGDSFLETPHITTNDLRNLSTDLIVEEITETLIAIDQNDIVEIADGIVDSIVVLLGTAVTYGIDVRPIWDEIHKTNMAKAGGEKRADGKLLKPSGWKEPDVEGLISKQME